MQLLTALIFVLIPSGLGKMFSIYGMNFDNNQTVSNEVKPESGGYSVYQTMMMNLQSSVSNQVHNHSETQINSSLHDRGNTTLSSPTAVITTATEAFTVLMEVALMGLLEGFLPHIERQRREATDVRRNYIDIVFNFFGALVGRQQCSEILACR